MFSPALQLFIICRFMAAFVVVSGIDVVVYVAANAAAVDC